MATLLEDIYLQTAWVVSCFKMDNLDLDYSLESLKLIDAFMDEHSTDGKPTPNGRLSQQLGPILFSIGGYIGETIIKNVPGACWAANDEDPLGEINVELKLPNGTLMRPMQRIINRFKNGPEDGIYAYGAVVIKDMSKDDFWERLRENKLQ